MKSFKDFFKEAKEEQVKGGKADNMTVEQIAKKHSVDVSKIEKQLAMGIKIEMEHTADKEIAREIAMDHLAEIPDYYTRLKNMETKAGIEDQ
jgi:hypothetical protein